MSAQRTRTPQDPEQDPETPEVAEDPSVVEAAGDESAELAELRDRHLRLAADFDNFRRRARQDQVDSREASTAAVAEVLLPVLDDFHRVVEHAPEDVDENWLKGVQLTLQNFDAALAGLGLEPIAAMGEPFDPTLHEAIGSEESNEHPDDTVLTEVRRGYRLGRRVLRPALVRVSRRPA